MAAVPSTGRADAAHPFSAPEAEATRALYERYANQIFGYCLHQLGSREEAEDAVQSTFLNAFRGLRRGIVLEQESAWLFKIAHNVCLSRRRSSWRRGRIESPADFELVEEQAPAPSRRADELIGLQDVLEAMPETQRRAILLREWQGLSYREIAAELELSQAAVETLIFRARRSLAQGLEQTPAEQRVRRARVRTSANLGGLATAIKSLLAGGAAVKAVGLAAVVAVTSVAATQPLRPHAFRHAQARPAAHASPARRVVGTAAAAAGPSFSPRRLLAPAAAPRPTPHRDRIRTARVHPARRQAPPRGLAQAPAKASTSEEVPAPAAPAATPSGRSTPTPPHVPSPTPRPPASKGRTAAPGPAAGHGNGNGSVREARHGNGNGGHRGNSGSSGHGAGRGGPAPTAPAPAPDASAAPIEAAPGPPSEPPGASDAGGNANGNGNGNGNGRQDAAASAPTTPSAAPPAAGGGNGRGKDD